MKKLILIFLLIFPLLSLAQSLPRHMIEISSRGFGGHHTYEKVSPRSSSDFANFDIFENRFAFNYSYTFHRRWQFGIFFLNRSDEREFRMKDGEEGEVEFKTLIWGVGLTWNLGPDLRNAPYLRLNYSLLNHEEEFSKNVFDYLEDDKDAQTLELVLGKRFQVPIEGLSAISYSPSVSVFVRESSKDYKDDGLEKSHGFTFQLIKFDVLF